MTIKDIARESGYAVGPVSRVLNNNPRVSEDARRKILAVVAQHGYQPNANAKHLKQQVPELFQELEPYIDKAPFDPEMTYIAYLFDCGILGLVLYVYCLFLLYRYYKKNLHTLGHAVEAYYILLATVFSALFYHYILFSPQVLLIVVGLAEIGHSCTRGKLLSEVRSG